MNENDVVKIVFAKDTTEALAAFRDLLARCGETEDFYDYYQAYLDAIASEKACVRGRGFKLLMANGKWDTKKILAKNLPQILAVLDDPRGTVVRQCLPTLAQLADYQPQLIPQVISKLQHLDYQNYRENMRPLIKQDVAQVLSLLQNA